MYVPRHIETVLARALDQVPAVLVTGPRQSGKTTLLRHQLPSAEYVTFDDPIRAEFATTDPRGFLAALGGRQVILDEIQYVPELLRYLTELGLRPQAMVTVTARAPFGGPVYVQTDDGAPQALGDKVAESVCVELVGEKAAGRQPN